MATIDETIIQLLRDESNAAALEMVKINYHDEYIKPSTLAALFLAYVNVVGWEDEKNGVSPTILIEDLCQINKWFRSTNGNQWARSDNSLLGKTYLIERTKKSNSVYSIKLVGFNNSLKRNRSIRKDIFETISNQRCAVLDVGTQIEVDHKNGRYNEESVSNLETQKVSDFQPLHKSANDAKRHHCQECIKNRKRYNAQRLGYKEGWVQGNADDEICIGCYWYDPKEFNRTISKDFKRADSSE